jgi:fructose-bisphosphate aldolase class II
MSTVSEIVRRAWSMRIVVPAFNVPYLPMIEPVVQAVIDQNAFALVDTARLEWLKFESKGPAEVAAEFKRWANPDYVRLHLDHVPVIDEDGQRVDFLPIFQEALALGYESVMVDGSRLSLEENIKATQQVVEMAHALGVPVEAELGAVMGHEASPVFSYEELWQSGRGFTDVDEARIFVERTGCDWLSVAIGNIHGAVAAARKDQKKVEARLNLERLEQLSQAAHIPLVLHGGSGIQRSYLTGAIKGGIAKINVATEIRQPYEAALRETGSVSRAQQAVYERTAWVLRDFLGISGLREKVI